MIEIPIVDQKSIEPCSLIVLIVKKYFQKTTFFLFLRIETIFYFIVIKHVFLFSFLGQQKTILENNCIAKLI